MSVYTFVEMQENAALTIQRALQLMADEIGGKVTVESIEVHRVPQYWRKIVFTVKCSMDADA